jgi:hypothetical protein
MLNYETMSYKDLSDLIGNLMRVRERRFGRGYRDPELVKQQVEALNELEGPMLTQFIKDSFIAVVKNQPGRELTLTVDEINLVGGWQISLNPDHVKRTFTFKVSKVN